MADFQDDKHKALDAKYNSIRQLLADIGSGDKPLRAVQPQLMVTSSGTDEFPQVTAALVVALETGTDTLDALTNLENSLRIAALGVHADGVQEAPDRIDVCVAAEMHEAPTLVDAIKEEVDTLCTLDDRVTSANDGKTGLLN